MNSVEIMLDSVGMTRRTLSLHAILDNSTTLSYSGGRATHHYQGTGTERNVAHGQFKPIGSAI